MHNQTLDWTKFQSIIDYNRRFFQFFRFHAVANQLIPFVCYLLGEGVLTRIQSAMFHFWTVTGSARTWLSEWLVCQICNIDVESVLTGGGHSRRAGGFFLYTGECLSFWWAVFHYKWVGVASRKAAHSALVAWCGVWRVMWCVARPSSLSLYRTLARLTCRRRLYDHLHHITTCVRPLCRRLYRCL